MRLSNVNNRLTKASVIHPSPFRTHTFSKWLSKVFLFSKEFWKRSAHEEQKTQILTCWRVFWRPVACCQTVKWKLWRQIAFPMCVKLLKYFWGTLDNQDKLFKRVPLQGWRGMLSNKEPNKWCMQSTRYVLYMDIDYVPWAKWDEVRALLERDIWVGESNRQEAAIFFRQASDLFRPGVEPIQSRVELFFSMSPNPSLCLLARK